MSSKVTERDVEVMVDIYKYRYLSVSQIEALHYPSRPVAWRRLRALTLLGYIKDFTAPGVPERVFYLDNPGAEVVAGHMQVTMDDLKWHRLQKAPKDYYFLRHFLAINDFRITLTRACYTSPLTLLGFIPEYVGEKTKQGDVKKYLRDNVCDITDTSINISHTPDGVFALGKDGNAALFFVEIDRGIEVVNDPSKGFLKAINFYLNYWSNQKFKRYEADFGGKVFKTFWMLVVTNSEKRLQNMREAVTKHPFPNTQAKRFLWGATDVTVDNFFSPIWQSMDITDTTTYKIG
jgi:hypothetical protein